MKSAATAMRTLIGTFVIASATSMPASVHAAESDESATPPNESSSVEGEVPTPEPVAVPTEPAHDRPTESSATPPWKASRLGVTYDLRANVSLVAMPSQTFHLGGYCSTISGLTPVSIYGQTAEDAGRGLGAGAGGRIGFMKRSEMLVSSVLSWWALRATLGLDLNFYHERSPTGFRAANGELCSVVAQTNHPVEYRSAVLVLTQVSLGLGALVAFGGEGPSRWRGVVLGLSWTPAVVHALAFEGASDLYLNPLGAEVTVDFAAIRSRANESHFRLAWFIAPPTTDSRPAITTLSAGIVSY